MSYSLIMRIMPQSNYGRFRSSLNTETRRPPSLDLSTSKVLGLLKGVIKNRGLGMNVKKVLYEKVVVPTVMYGSESWGMKAT